MHASNVEIYQTKQNNFGKKQPGRLSKVALLEVWSIVQAKLGRNPYQSILSVQRGRKGLCLRLYQDLTSPTPALRPR